MEIVEWFTKLFYSNDYYFSGQFRWRLTVLISSNASFTWCPIFPGSCNKSQHLFNYQFNRVIYLFWQFYFISFVWYPILALSLVHILMQGCVFYLETLRLVRFRTLKNSGSLLEIRIDKLFSIFFGMLLNDDTFWKFSVQFEIE